VVLGTLSFVLTPTREDHSVVHRSGDDDDLVAPAYVTRYAAMRVPWHKTAEESVLPKAAARLIHNALLLDDGSRCVIAGLAPRGPVTEDRGRRHEHRPATW
jgi:hypothetical protein